MAILVSRCRHSFKSEFKSFTYKTSNQQITDEERFIPSYIHYITIADKILLKWN